jgi:O-succinylbenzoate synthase
MIKPQYVVLKPGLLGGINSCNEWIEIANEMKIGWWITSSLETNIGLNAIAQWTYTLKNPVFHGLSTGTLFENNIDSPPCSCRRKVVLFPA